MAKRKKKPTVAQKIIRGLREAHEWAKGKRPLRVTTFKKGPNGELIREVGEKYRDEV